MNYCLLRLVDADCNNNKEYEMNQISETAFVASWGRIKGTKMKKTYSMSVWDKIHHEKVAKGYSDVTNLVAVVKKETGKYADIPDKAVKKLVDDLLEAANKHLQATYEVDKEAVTSAMVQEAERVLSKMDDCIEDEDIQSFNWYLQKLLIVIPQKVKNVSSLMARTSEDMSEISMKQQGQLNVLKSMIGTDSVAPAKDDFPTILEAFGLDIRACTDKEIAKIKEKLTSESEGRLKTAFRIEQKDLEARYKKYLADNSLTKRDEHFLWHGTRNENVWSIARKGMLLNPKAVITGKMFGFGLYFAPRAKKSIGYTSLDGALWTNGKSKHGYMFVMKVAYKNPYDVYTHRNEYAKYREKDLRAKGCDALFAHKGQMLFNDEIIVYNEAQVCPRYLLVLE